MTKKSLISIITGAVIFVILIVTATFFDLEISIALADADNVFGQFFAVFGMSYLWLIIPFAGIVFYHTISDERKFGRLLKSFFVIVTAIGWYLVVKDYMKRFGVEIKASYLYKGVFAVILTIISILATNRVDKKIMEKLVIFAVFALVAAAISVAITEFLKFMCSRQRFRNMPEGDYTGFTQWYRPNWFGKGHDGAEISDFAGASDDGMFESFPSGHTMAATMSFTLVMLPELFEKLKKYSVWFVVAPSLFTAATMLSRIIARAHFLSDVVFGAFITLSVIFLVKFLLKIFMKKMAQKNIDLIKWLRYGSKNAENVNLLESDIVMGDNIISQDNEKTIKKIKQEETAESILISTTEDDD